MRKSITGVIASLSMAALLAFVPAAGARADGEVTIDSTTFPDKHFRNYVTKVIDDGDGKLTQDEIDAVSGIEVNNRNIEDITGIELFKNLTLLNISGNNIKNIDVSIYKDLTFLSCSNNLLSDLDVTGNTKLETLECDGNDLTSLDVTNNTKLGSLSFTGNKISSLDLSSCTDLIYLHCHDNELESLDVSKNTKLETLGCSGNKISELNVDNNTALTDLSADHNLLSEIKLSNNGALAYLDVSSNKLSALDISGNEVLEYLYCPSNELTSLDTSGSDAVTTIDCTSNQIASLDLSSNSKIKVLKCGSNPLGSLDVSNLKDLSELHCAVCGLTGLDLSKNKKLQSLSCAGNKLTTIDLGELTELVMLDICENKLTSIDVSKNKDLASFACSYNVIASLDLANNKKLLCLRCEGNKITELDITKCDELLKIYKDGKAKDLGTYYSYDYNNALDVLVFDKTTKVIIPEPVLTLDQESMDIIVGEQGELTATLKNATGKITWKTSDKKVATVDSTGKITAKMAGTVTVTASAAGKTAECKVVVLYLDVTDKNDFWYTPTNYLTAAGVVKGYNKQTKFKPTTKCTRAQMVTFIWRLSGEPAPKSQTCKFTDVKTTDYFYKACIWGNENHIVEGYKDGTFGPQIVCARRHAVTFLWRLAGKPQPSASANRFSDVKETDYFYKATVWAAEKNILEGYEDNTFRPNGACLRRQMVTFLYKYDKFINKKG